MFNKIFISKKKISKFKISSKNPFNLTCEKVTQTPRVFNTKQIKSATENIVFTDIEEVATYGLILQAVSYVLKDFFLYMHQTGLYNRQPGLWKTMGQVTQGLVSKLQKGLFKKKELETYVVDFFVDPKAPCFNIIFQENNSNSINQYLSLQTCLTQVLSQTKISKIKGIFYFLNNKPNNELITKLDLITQASNPISRYESILPGTNHASLNIISFNKENGDYCFQHIYPELKPSNK